MSLVGTVGGAVASPCTSVCTLDPATGLCLGCGRTLDEIAGWIDMSDVQKREVLAALAERRARRGGANTDGDR
jgi:predicted Fe-S protein YdhL (DUF1289 family)